MKSGTRPTFFFNKFRNVKMKSDFLIALTQLAAERNLPRNTVISAIELALAAAYKKDNFDPDQNISVTMDPGSGDVTVYVLKEVVETVENELIEISLEEAKKIIPSSEINDTMKIDSHLYNAGRIAAQTAKQVVMQKLREAERDLIFEEYAEKFDNVVTGNITKVEPGGVTVDLGRTEAYMPDREKVNSERYRVNQKLKFYILEVNKGTRNPEIIISRAHKDLLRKLFEVEIPEISNRVVEIKSISREPGSRSKIAVWTEQEGVDAVGSCVGLRGIRIQNIVNELQGEKIDIVQWNSDPKVFIANSLNPSQVLNVNLDYDNENAVVAVQDKQLSLAIGKEGQNARLAAKLTGWKIDIISGSEAEQMELNKEPEKDTVELDNIAPETETETAIIENQPEPLEEQGLEEVEVEIVAEPVSVENTVAPDEIEKSEVDLALDRGEISIEEALANLEIEETTKDEKIESVEPESISLTDDIWQIPQLAGSNDSPQIRFAEDIVETQGRDQGGRKSRKTRSTKNKKGPTTNKRDS
tara:strand:- start:7721 stop:9307 length:1587 start_codon:yes stop_codon:yes gene_type:complete